ncbi:helix-turn-helix domain-containing protein [Saccharothrix lopnurensis]|uniref:Multiprotein-bridging factor 1 family protein n=1 Tax=Saccharothrix lopnurensis TaxID=1670621 RepID=A0ABW1P6E3_9PSEU
MEPSLYGIRLRREELCRAREAAGLRSDSALARAIGVNRSTVTRILAGDLQPGAAFIAGVVAVFARFDRYFEVVRAKPKWWCPASTAAERCTGMSKTPVTLDEPPDLTRPARCPNRPMSTEATALMPSALTACVPDHPGNVGMGRSRLVVPYIAMWSEEVVEDPRLVVLPGGRGIAYADEILGDRDSQGVLWDRATINPGHGTPRFAQIHVHRQRRAMRKLLCQVCGNPADRNDDGTLWLIPDRTREWSGWPEGMVVAEPPICLPCAHLATRVCPALRKEGHFVIRAREHPIHGVDGLHYRQGADTLIPVTSEPVAFEDPAIRWVLASKLVRSLRDCTVVTDL